MSADRRTPHTDALDTLGKIHEYIEKRDAIHLGVEPVEAAEALMPGEHIGLENGKAVRLHSHLAKAVGIVDPFLLEEVQPGQRFWLVVYPRQITSLRHVWEHPDFPLSGETDVQPQPSAVQLHKMNLLLGEEKAVARDTIERIAASIGAGFDELMQAAEHFLAYGEYWCEGGRFEGESIPDSFWPAYETYTQTQVPANDKYSFLSCAC